MSAQSLGAVAAEWVDRVLDHMATRHRVTGEVRPDNRYGWVTALHVLTEQVLGLERQQAFSTGTTYHTQYANVAAAVRYLESLGILGVQRAYGDRPAHANVVEAIWLVYS